MVNRVVEHFGETIVPNIEHVLGKLAQKRAHIIAPNYILLQIGTELIELDLFFERTELVDSATSVSVLDENFLIDQMLQMLVHGLPRDLKFV